MSILSDSKRRVIMPEAIFLYRKFISSNIRANYKSLEH